MDGALQASFQEGDAEEEEGGQEGQEEEGEKEEEGEEEQRAPPGKRGVSVEGRVGRS